MTQPDASRGRGRPRQGDQDAGQLVTLHLRMPLALRHRWHAEATRREVDLVVVLREAIDDHLERHREGPIAPPPGRLTETTAQVDESTQEDIAQEAKRRGGSMAGVVREALENWLDAHEGAAGTATSP